MNSPRRMTIRLLAATLVLGLNWTVQTAHAEEELRKGIAGIAQDLKKLLAGRSEDSLAITKMEGPANLPTSAGPGLIQLLSLELKKVGITVKTRAKFGIKGEFNLTEKLAANAGDRRLGKKVLALKLKVADVFGNLLIDLERDVEGEAAILIALGLPASLPPGGTELQRDREVRKRVFDPKSVINGSIIQSKAGSPYAIEILVNGTAKSAKDDEGLAFVKIKRGETYAVRLINKSPHEAAVKLRIDGLSMFAFSELRDKGSPRYSAVIVPAKSSVTIKGWHVTNKATDKFLVTSYAKSAAKILKSTAKVGTITASFQAAWKLNEQPPADEAGKRKGGDGDATGRGPRIDVKFKEVQRNLGKIRDNIVVRYTKPQ